MPTRHHLSTTNALQCLFLFILFNYCFSPLLSAKMKARNDATPESHGFPRESGDEAFDSKHNSHVDYDEYSNRGRAHEAHTPPPSVAAAVADPAAEVSGRGCPRRGGGALTRRWPFLLGAGRRAVPEVGLPRRTVPEEPRLHTSGLCAIARESSCSRGWRRRECPIGKKEREAFSLLLPPSSRRLRGKVVSVLSRQRRKESSTRQRSDSPLYHSSFGHTLPTPPPPSLPHPPKKIKIRSRILVKPCSSTTDLCHCMPGDNFARSHTFWNAPPIVPPPPPPPRDLPPLRNRSQRVNQNMPSPIPFCRRRFPEEAGALLCSGERRSVRGFGFEVEPNR